MSASGVTTIRLFEDPAVAAVRDALATIGNVMFLETSRLEAVNSGPRNPALNDLLLTAERQLLWDALRRLQGHDGPDEPVLLSELQAKHVKALDWLKHTLEGGDPLSVLFLTDIQAVLRRRTRLSSSGRKAS